jgi:type IV pilus assembly protein PilN
MIRINLLPHRELKRAALKRQFTVLAGGTAIIGALMVLLVHTAISSRIDAQMGRNNFLKTETAKLDKQIDEIKKLKEQIQELLARKQVVEGLQSNRSIEVHLLDQLVRILPEGVYLSSVKQQGNGITLTGYAQSNARVSTLMRNIETSVWLQSPQLIVIKAATVNNLRASEFVMTVKLVPPAPPSAPEPQKGVKR